MIVDLSKCKISDRHGMYGGQAGDKDGILYNNEYWIVKFPKSTKGMKGNDLPSYTSSPLSEYLGSHIYQILGYDAHETILGERNNKIVVACKDFREPSEILMEIRAVKNAANKEIQEQYGENVPASATGDAVNLDELLMHFKVNQLMNSPDIIKRFWECAIVDILIDNNDRNNGNWGILKNEITKQRRLAPIYDNGNAFNNKLSDEQVKAKLSLPSDQKITYATGTRTSFMRDGHPISPQKLLRFDIPELKEAIKNVVPKINQKLNAIANFIDSIPEKYNGKIVFSNERKQLYKDFLQIRYDKLLLPAYEKEKNIAKNEKRGKDDVSLLSEVQDEKPSAIAQGRGRPAHSGRAKPATMAFLKEKERCCKMEKSKNSGLQGNKNAITKPNPSKKQGVTNKEKFALWAYPETLEEVGQTYEQDNCRSKSEFIEKAVKFYLGYLKQERNVNYLSPMITSTMEAVVNGCEQRMNRNMFKIAVELGKIAHTLAAANDVDEDTLRELHEMCLDEVRHINGCISFNSAVRFQNNREDTI